MKRKLYLVILCLLCFRSLVGQQYYFRQYKVENGLSHNTVFTSIQDKHGYIWLGTKIGLNRFDGHNFKQFINNPKESKSLGCNNIKTLHEYNNTIWVGTDNGLFKYNENQENFDVLSTTENSSISDIKNDSLGNLWFIANRTLYKYAIEKNEYSEFPEIENSEITSITKDKNGTIWVSSYTNLYSFSDKLNAFEKHKVIDKTTNELPFIITKILGSKQNTILVGTQNHGVIIYDKANDSYQKLHLSDIESLYIRDMVEIGENKLWIGSEFGLFLYNYDTKTSENFKKSYNNPYSVSDNAIYSITIDKEDGMWVGTYFGGVNYSPKPNTPFKKYFAKIDENSISGNIVREIHEDKYNNIWIGTEDNGLNKLNPNTGKITNYKPSTENKTIAYHNIHGILPRGDTLWVGTFEHGLDLMNVKTGKIIKHFSTGEENSLRSNFVHTIYETKLKDILILTTGGVQKYDFKKRNFSQIEGFPEYNFFNSILEDNNNSLWLGTFRDGLFKYNPKTKTKTQFKHQSKNEKSLSSNVINGIFQDSSKNIWITTENGLNLYDETTKDFRRFTIEDGFPSNAMYSIIEETKNILWISTANGLAKFNSETKEIKVYSKSNGLLSNQFNYSSGYKDKNGNIYFGSVEGLITFKPSEFTQSNYKPTILISDLLINNKEVQVNTKNSPLLKTIANTNTLTLKRNQSSFGLNFSTLSYNSPEMTKYWYQMEGLNNNWVSLDKNHSVFFTELPPRTYKFQVKSLNNNGVWSEPSKLLNIEVLPTFWQSNLAYFIYTIFGLFISYLMLKIYHKKTQEKNSAKIKELNNKKEKEIYQAKIEFFTNISHEIRTPLTLIKSPLEKILNLTQNMPNLKENLSIMDRNTTRLLDLVNQLLDFRKTEMGNINLTFVETNITQLIKQTQIRFSNAIKDKNIDFKTELNLPETKAFVDTEAVKKILSNLFNNAIKYAKKQIYVTLSQTDKDFIFTIKNDGPIIDASLKNKIFEPFFRVEGASQTGTGIGLSLAHSLAELHKGNLQLDTSDLTLNTFVLTLPLHQEQEFKFYTAKTADVNDFNIDEENEFVEENYKSTILVVEDNEDLLNFVAKDLNENYHVLTAKSAEDALGLIQEKNVQLIVSDVMMQGISGFDLCEKVKNDLETSHIPVILLTSKSTITAKITGLKSGADAYIEKPFSMDYLKLQILNLLKNRDKVMAYFSSSPLAHIKSIAHSTIDEVFIKKLEEAIFENISDQDLSVDTLAEIMNMSRSTFYRKIKNISQLSPNELINITRLKKAAELLKTGEYKIYEIATIVGYNSQTSFGRNFQKQFNMTPSEYMSSN